VTRSHAQCSSTRLLGEESGLPEAQRSPRHLNMLALSISMLAIDKSRQSRVERLCRRRNSDVFAFDREGRGEASASFKGGKRPLTAPR